MSWKHSERSVIIEARRKIFPFIFIEMFSFRDLLYFLTWRDLKVRYKQTVIGVAWVFFRPLIMMVVFTIFFGKFVGIQSEGIPYPIFVYTGLLLWQFFSDSISEISGSLVGNQSLITKIYFPRLLLPISAVATRLVDFLLASLIFLGMMVYYRYVPGIESLVIIPFLVFLTALLATGLGSFLAALNVQYRDVRYILPFFIQGLFFITPVIYPTSIVDRYAWLLSLNPMTGIIDASRAVLLHQTPIHWEYVLLSTLLTGFSLIFGLWYFFRAEQKFADVI